MGSLCAVRPGSFGVECGPGSNGVVCAASSIFFSRVVSIEIWSDVQAAAW
jgi:hypothetical protein